MGLDFLMQQVKDAITGHTEQQNQNPTQAYDANPLLGMVEGIFGQHSQTGGQPNVQPASQDPYGDPADQQAGGQYSNVQAAAQDPYGDPADQGQGNVLPASQDPYGDPADR
jgi:hypothetical protein